MRLGDFVSFPGPAGSNATEDDLREFLEQCLWPSEKVGVVSLYTYRENHRDETGWHAANNPWGACAYVFTPLSARKLVAETSMTSAAVDRRVRRYFKQAALDYLCHSPALVQHVGKTSTLHNMGLNSHRRAKVWCEDAVIFLKQDAQCPTS